MKSYLLLSAVLIICSICPVYAQVPEKLTRDSILQTGENPKEALYLGVENTLSILVHADPGDKITYRIDQGKIIQRNDSIFALVDHIGKATVTVSRFGSDGKLKEEGEAEFIATKLPPPYVTLKSLSGNSFNASQPNLILQLKLPQEFVKLGYQVLEFALFSSDDTGKKSTVPGHIGDMVSLEDIIKAMDPSNTRIQHTDARTIVTFSRAGQAQQFTIANIKIRDREGKTYLAPNLVFEVQF